MRFWRRLTEPSAAIRESERRRARLLSSLLLVLVPLGLLAIVISSLGAYPTPGPIQHILLQNFRDLAASVAGKGVRR